jgi:hypothetical protein
MESSEEFCAYIHILLVGSRYHCHSLRYGESGEGWKRKGLKKNIGYMRSEAIVCISTWKFNPSKNLALNLEI